MASQPPIDLKTIVQLCADPEDVGDTLAKIAASKVKQLADFQDMTNDDLETTVKDIPTGIKSKLRKALLPLHKLRPTKTPLLALVLLVPVQRLCTHLAQS
jgi:hypothetical protein